MRRIGFRIAGAVGVAVLLSACGSAGFSYNDGFTVGQSVAANAIGGSMDGHQAALACNREWRLSSPAGATKKDWLRGCHAGYRKVATTIRP